MDSISIHLSVINKSVKIYFSKKNLGKKKKRIKTGSWVLGISPITISASNLYYQGKDLPTWKRVGAEFRAEHHLPTENSIFHPTFSQ